MQTTSITASSSSDSRVDYVYSTPYYQYYTFSDEEENYNRELKERQRRHLEGIRSFDRPFQPCMHDQCSECQGTGIKSNGGMCVHHMSCPCPKCTPQC